MATRVLAISMTAWLIFLVMFTPFALAGVLDKRLEDCANVIEEIMRIPEQDIPRDLLHRCAAIAVFPQLIKGGFFVGGRYGRGIIIARNEETGRWSSPSFFTLLGGSYGFQAGVQSVDLILFMNRRGLESLLDSKMTLGGDIGFAVGPMGRRSEVGTDAALKAEIQSYSRSRGAFAGLSVHGAAIYQDKIANHAFYGMEVSARDVLSIFDISPPDSAKKLIDTLRKTSTHDTGA
jgi:lipid-binding SYLF domain-containing protein